MNYMIIRAVRESGKMHMGTYNSESEANENNPQTIRMKQVETQLIRMLVIIATVHVILFLPSYIRFVYSQMVDVRSSPTIYAGYFFFVHFSFKLYATNSGIHFFLYLFSGLKFRNDLKQLLRIKSGGKNKYLDCNNHESSTGKQIYITDKCLCYFFDLKVEDITTNKSPPPRGHNGLGLIRVNHLIITSMNDELIRKTRIFQKN